MFLSYFPLILFSLFLNTVNAAYKADGQNIALYWGAGGGQKSLGYYCESQAADIIMLSFLNNWDATSASFNFGNACGSDTCPQIEEDILTCQKLGIKVLLSFGGDDRRGKYGLKTNDDGESLAQVVYDMFNPAGNSSVKKPFGKAEIDGIDFDIENHNDKGLAALVTKLRTLWSSKELIVSACPQCPFPDQNVFNLLEDSKAKVDIAFIQYYNNGCAMKNLNTFNDNWKTWEDWQQTKAGNKDIKLYIGLASNGRYNRDADYIEKNSQTARNNKDFGGFFLWDAASGFANVNKKTGLNYVYEIRNIIRNEKALASTIVSASSTTLAQTIISKSTSSVPTTVKTKVYISANTGTATGTKTSSFITTSNGEKVVMPILIAEPTTTSKIVTSSSYKVKTVKTIYTSTSISISSVSATTTTTTYTYMSELSSDSTSSVNKRDFLTTKLFGDNGLQMRKIITILSTISIPTSATITSSI